MIITSERGVQGTDLLVSESASVDVESSVEGNEESISQLKDLFRNADLNGDGVIDKAELKFLLQSTDGGLQRVTKHPDWLTDEDVSKWLTKYDWDSSGDISFNEFQALVNGGALLDGKLEEYERAWQAAGGADISVASIGALFEKLGQPLDAGRLADVEKQLELVKPGRIGFPQFLEMFRADLLDLREILAFLQMGSKSPDGLLSRTEIKQGEVTVIRSEQEFDFVMAEHAERLIVLEASMTWCRPCKGFERAYQKFAAQYVNTIFLKFFGNENEYTKHLFETRLNTPNTPTFTFWRRGEKIHQHSGGNKVKMEDALQRHLLPEENPLTGANAFKRQVWHAKLGIS
ncbi:probable thioredoxin at C-terminar half [Coccomyxa sp. Obi]|nr:probable thioredoxin at C-terminar half [Coccomyxa sp. Obi]